MSTSDRVFYGTLAGIAVIFAATFAFGRYMARQKQERMIAEATSRLDVGLEELIRSYGDGGASAVNLFIRGRRDQAAPAEGQPEPPPQVSDVLPVAQPPPQPHVWIRPQPRGMRGDPCGDPPLEVKDAATRGDG